MVRRPVIYRIHKRGRKMKRIIGITGGVGSGKSCILELLEQEFQAKVILADEVARSLMEAGSSGYQQVTKTLGTGF